jgi:hypothetical protein
MMYAGRRQTGGWGCVETDWEREIVILIARSKDRKNRDRDEIRKIKLYVNISRTRCNEESDH